MAVKKWIKGAIEHKGALTAKAKAAGMSPMAYAEAHQHDKGTTGRQARLALILQHRKVTKARPAAKK